MARSDPAKAGAGGVSAFLVERSLPGVSIGKPEKKMGQQGAHICDVIFDNVRVPVENRIGAEGEGFKVAMRTLDVFRTSVAAASLGFARRAFDEAMERATSRKMFGGVLGDFQLSQAKLAQMALTIDSAALLTYRAAWLRDTGANVTREAAMAKLAATEGAQQVIDAAVQLWGGRGVQSGETVERLYREIRALRIYEGASEVQQLIIGRDLLKAHGQSKDKDTA
jgi:acyl-CoA dehydrogenase